MYSKGDRVSERKVEPFDDWQPVDVVRPPAARKGRGAVSNLQGRYEVHARETVDDGWGGYAQEEGEGGRGG
jgi:hypothetical protein